MDDSVRPFGFEIGSHLALSHPVVQCFFVLALIHYSLPSLILYLMH